MKFEVILDIYIYGLDSFKSKIFKLLEHANISLKIDEGQILEVTEVDDLKEKIKQTPTDIFIIDQNTILNDGFIDNMLFKLSDKVKPLQKVISKDKMIEKKFLDEYGIGDISIREYDDLIIYIYKRLEAIENAKPKAHEITQIDDMLEDDTLEAIEQIQNKI